MPGSPTVICARRLNQPRLIPRSTLWPTVALGLPPNMEIAIGIAIWGTTATAVFTVRLGANLRLIGILQRRQPPIKTSALRSSRSCMDLLPK